jgi:hypothetical protein
MWPERWQPGATAAEVKAALAKPSYRLSIPAPVQKPPPEKPKPEMSLSAAARLLHITPAGMLKRVRKHGWAAAMAMGGRHDRAKCEC